MQQGCLSMFWSFRSCCNLTFNIFIYIQCRLSLCMRLHRDVKWPLTRTKHIHFCTDIIRWAIKLLLCHHPRNTNKIHSSAASTGYDQVRWQQLDPDRFQWFAFSVHINGRSLCQRLNDHFVDIHIVHITAIEMSARFQSQHGIEMKERTKGIAGDVHNAVRSLFDSIHDRVGCNWKSIMKQIWRCWWRNGQ